MNNRFLTRCPLCQGRTTKVFVRQFGRCKNCRDAQDITVPGFADDQNRQARIIDSGWQAYAIEEGHYDDGSDR